MSTQNEKTAPTAGTPKAEAEARARRQLLKGGAVAGLAGASVVGLGRNAWAGGKKGGSAGASAGHS